MISAVDGDPLDEAIVIWPAIVIMDEVTANVSDEEVPDPTLKVTVLVTFIYPSLSSAS